MISRILVRILRPIAQIETKEATTALLMFSISFLAMTTHNIIKPAATSKFIESLGANKLPYVQFVAGIIIGMVMAGYSWLLSRLPRRWCLPIVQGGIALMLIGFWYGLRSGQAWVSVAFYLVGRLILGTLLISQFWTLANVVYDARQAKRLFGFIGGGSSLGGLLGSIITVTLTGEVGPNNLPLISACFMILCVVVISAVIYREKVEVQDPQPALQKQERISGKKAIEMLRQSKHLRLIALVIGFASIGAGIIEQQLSMAAQASKGQQATDAITVFLAQVQLFTSLIGFILQITLTSRIQRYLGIGFALLLLPASLGTTGLIMLLNAALWAPSLARVFDQSLRYTIDKTTREILYMPLPSDVKFEAKPFVDVTVDRVAKGLAAVLMVVLIEPWGLGLGWQKLSIASLLITGIWVFVALRAKQGYRAAFRQSLENQQLPPDEFKADLSAIETLVQELGHPDEKRVLYVIDLLESLDKTRLLTPLLLNHRSPAVRARALSILSKLDADIAVEHLSTIQGMIRDESSEVRLAALGALANMRDQQTLQLVRSLLEDKDPRIAMTAAMVLAGTGNEEDTMAAETLLTGLVADTRESAAGVRRDFAIALRHVPVAHFRRLLIPLLYDANPEVAEEAMTSARKVGASDFIFVPTFISLLRHPKLKSSARELLMGYGEPVLGILDHFLRDPDEDIWVRRRIPATIARIPCQKAMDILISALQERDGRLRFQVVAAIERLHRLYPELTFGREPIESMLEGECSRCTGCRTLYRTLFEEHDLPRDSLLPRALAEKIRRSTDRAFRLLSLLYPWKDIAAARLAIDRGDARSRAAALEYLDNLLSGPLRKKLMPLLEQALRDVKAGAGAGAAKGNGRILEQAVTQLIDDEDPVLSVAAISFAWEQKMAGLVGDLERVLATRTVNDWIVFEAASWVLAAFRMPESQRKSLWLEPLPVVAMADQLHRLPLFRCVNIDELFRICQAGRQLRHEPGKVLFQEKLVPETIHFLLDGRVALKISGGDIWEIAAPAALGFQEVLEGSPMKETVRTLDTGVCMTLSSEECRALLADNTELVQGLFEMLCRDSDRAGRLVVKGKPAAKSLPVLTGGLKPIERVMVLQTVPVLSEVSAEEELALSTIMDEVPLKAGSLVFSESDPPALYALVSGEICLESPGGEPPLCAVPPDVIGIFETLAGLVFNRRARVARDGLALRVDREELFDMLGQRPELLQQIFSALFREWTARTA